MAKILPGEPCPCDSGLTFAECHGPKVRTLRAPEIRRALVLQVIPEPELNTRTVLIQAEEDTIFFKGFDTDLAFACGNCGAHLAEGIEMGQIQGIVLCCKKCGAYNDT